jgi:hypothetical protein
MVYAADDNRCNDNLHKREHKRGKVWRKIGRAVRCDFGGPTVQYTSATYSAIRVAVAHKVDQAFNADKNLRRCDRERGIEVAVAAAFTPPKYEIDAFQLLQGVKAQERNARLHDQPYVWMTYPAWSWRRILWPFAWKSYSSVPKPKNA